MGASDRSKFDSKLRDILMGRSPDDPMPPALNNKFDALPPAEGLLLLIVSGGHIYSSDFLTEFNLKDAFCSGLSDCMD